MIVLVEFLLMLVVTVISVAVVFSYVRQWHKRMSARYYVVTEHGCFTVGAHEFRRLSRRGLVKESVAL